MLDITEKFLNDIEKIEKDEIIKDDGYYAIFLCEEIGKMYMNEYGGNVNKTINAFNEIYNDKEAADVLRCMAGICVCVIKLRVAKTREDINLKKHALDGIRKFLEMIDKII